jgi:hypothetical protein
LALDPNACRCQGPIEASGDWPSETCGAIATHGFFFPYQGGGIAFIFACESHMNEVGGWGGRHFGGCFGDVIAKSKRVIEEAARSGQIVSFRHGHEYERLSPVPNPPKAPPPRDPS